MMVLHSWEVSYEQAREIQQQLRGHLKFPLRHTAFRYMAGADVAFDAATRRILAAVVVIDAADGRVCDEAYALQTARFPYIPGLLSFREAPAVLEAWGQLKIPPEALLVDGQGLAHPRRFGLACHLGMWLDIPAVGCAKSRLIGDYEEPAATRGSWSELRDGGEIVGAVVRTKDRVRPLFVSAGYMLPLESCIELTLQWARGYRLPEPTRQAHLRVTARRREWSSRNPCK
jgi:deoxyribonuclease V